MWTLQETEPAIGSPIDALWRQLAETVAWCDRLANTTDPALCLRSAALRPRVMQGSYSACVWDVTTNRRSALDRRSALGRTVRPRQDLAGGRILVYGPDETLSDGAAEVETRGYLDADNCPPWDTWVALIQFTDGGRGRAAHLYSWVPPEFVESVDRGIEVNPERCIEWLEDWKPVGPSGILDALLGALAADPHG